MKKDKALGHDPLSWIKATRESESRQTVKGEEQVQQTRSLQPEEQETTGLEATMPEIKKPADETLRSAQGKVEEIKKNPSIEEPAGVRGQESRVWSQSAPGGRPQGLGLETLKPYITTRTNGSPIIFVIAYAVLLLVLTFFVYFNLSKRIDDMSSRISNVEKAVNTGFKEEGIMH